MNNKENKLNFKKDHTKKLKELLIGKIHQLGTFHFADNSWYFSKRHKDSLPKGNYTITFHQVPEDYKEWVKYYALLCTSSTSHTLKKCLIIARFLKFIIHNYGYIPKEKIERNHINAYEYELKLSNKSVNLNHFTYSSLQDFFVKLTDFNEMPNIVPTKNINPFRQIRKKDGQSIIPTKVIRAWDRTMKDQTKDIPLEFRTLYWLIRSFPNRITEILSMKRDCLKSLYSEYILQIPTYKQNGGYTQEEVKSIPVIYTGHGKFVIDLIKELRKQTEELLASHELPENINSDYLFIVRYWTFMEKNGEIKVRYDPRYKNNLRNWVGFMINNLFKQLTPILNIRDEDRNLIIPTTHQFRHNAVTDRLYKVGYTTEQIRRLTGHKNEAMTKHYTHQLIEKHKEIHLGIENLRSSNDSPVEFHGKIMNLDERTTKQLSRDPRRYLTWEANGKKGVGICSDITGCNPKGTSVHFECYACDWFVPKLEYLKDYKAEYEYWMDVVDRTSGDTKRAAHFENAIRNVSYLERILKICENGIEHFKEEKLQEQLDRFNTPPVWE